MTWKDSVKRELHKYAETEGREELTLGQFYAFAEDRLANKYPDNNHVRAKIRQVLQQLRDQGDIRFVDGNGRYAVEDGPEGDRDEEQIAILEQIESDFEDL